MTGGVDAVPAARKRAPGHGPADASAFIGTALNLLGRHFPTLLAVSAGGVAAQWGATRLAVVASNWHPLAGALTLMVVPLLVLMTYVLMMRVVRGSLPFARTVHDGSGTYQRGLLDHLGSVLLPFLAVWSAQGYLDDTIEQYRFDVWQDYRKARFAAVLEDRPLPLTDTERLDLGLSTAVVAVIVLAFAARWALGRLRRPRTEGGPPRGPRWLGVVAAYLESVWLMLVFIPLAALPELLNGRLGDLRIVSWYSDLQIGVTDRIGEVSNPLALAAGAVLAVPVLLLANAQTVILAPVAWLTVGAVVYGHRLADLARDHEERHTGRGGFLRRWARGQYRGQFNDRFGPLLAGLRLLARGSTRPLLLFCLLFLVISPLVADGRRLGGLEGWLWDAERWLIGPQPDQRWLFWDQMLTPLNTIVTNVALVCLLSAAIDRLVLAQHLDPELRATPQPQAPLPMPHPPFAPPPAFAQPAPTAPPAFAPPPAFAQPAPTAPPAFAPPPWSPPPPFAPPPPPPFAPPPPPPFAPPPPPPQSAPPTWPPPSPPSAMHPNIPMQRQPEPAVAIAQIEDATQETAAPAVRIEDEATRETGKLG
ncbi:hypothetical protein [Dactylosporangium sp. NPDC051541]|uniref:hypothetical protein n=1 Tax=Dactylosporangium sp. NPDC051541 TaxID=3363977 RepID=UPI0037878D30